MMLKPVADGDIGDHLIGDGGRCPHRRRSARRPHAKAAKFAKVGGFLAGLA